MGELKGGFPKIDADFNAPYVVLSLPLMKSKATKGGHGGSVKIRLLKRWKLLRNKKNIMRVIDIIYSREANDSII